MATEFQKALGMNPYSVFGIGFNWVGSATLDLLRNYPLRKKDVKIATHINALRKKTRRVNRRKVSAFAESPPLENAQGPSTEQG